jgi:hypothetical protein
LKERQDEIPREVRAFIADNLGSVVQFETLLLLHAAPDREWTADGVAASLRIDRAWAEGQLEVLCAEKLAASGDGPPRRYRFAPGDPKHHGTVDALARAYAERRVTVISLIFAKPADTLRGFSDAFRLRGDDTNHG